MGIIASAEQVITNTGVEEAAKTATNYLFYDATDGLYVTDDTDTLDNAVKIDSDSMDIIKGGDTVATFTDSKVELGMNSVNSYIDMCGGVGRILATTNYMLELLCGSAWLDVGSESNEHIARIATGSASLIEPMPYAGVELKADNSSAGTSSIDLRAEGVNINEIPLVINAGDTVSFNTIGAGYLSAKSTLLLNIPLGRIVTATTATVTSAQLRTRQNGALTHGSTSGGYVSWTHSGVAIVNNGSFLRVTLTRETTTNATASDTIGYTGVITIAFSNS